MKHAPKRAACFVLFLITLTLQGCATPTPTDTGAQAPAPPTPSIPVTAIVESAINSTLPPHNRQAVSVHHFDGIILITGQVLSEEEKSRVSNAVSISAGLQLRRLSNELRVVDRIDLTSTTVDANLAMAARTMLASSDPALAELTLVVVDNARLYLLGRLTRAQGDAATGLLRRLQGISTVIILFDYTD